MTRLRVAVTNGVVLLLLGLALPSTAADLDVGALAPDFTLKDWSTAETEHSLSGLKGKVVVLQFGSSTAWEYVKSIEALETLQKKYKGKGVQVFTVYTREADGTWQATSDFDRSERAKGLRFAYGLQTHKRMLGPVLLDDLQDSTFKAYGQPAAGVFVVDKAGKIAFRAVKPNVAEVDKVLQKLTE
jgi:peroxiredoxin